MCKLAAVTSIDIGLEFKVYLIQSAKRMWAMLTSKNWPNQLCRFWSIERDVELGHAYEVLIREITGRLKPVASDPVKASQALMFWPAGWDYWGAGIPHEIGHYMRGGDFDNQLRVWDSGSPPARN